MTEITFLKKGDASPDTRTNIRQIIKDKQTNKIAK